MLFVQSFHFYKKIIVGRMKKRGGKCMGTCLNLERVLKDSSGFGVEK
jgi:hypothetical protein